MALVRCSFGHDDCFGHSVKPDLTALPSRDDPKAGRCWCGEVSWLWQLPLDGRWYCVSCLRMQLRIATYPDAIRFPEVD